MTCLLTNRAVLAISGADATQLLQATLTQHIATGQTGLRYACHLSPQGRLRFDCFVFEHAGRWLLDVHQPKLMTYAQALHSYAHGMDVTFDDLSTEWHIISHLEEPAAAPTPLTFTDPRQPQLGAREYVPSPPPNAASAQEASDYLAHRVAFGIPDTAYDAPPNKALPAELGLDHLNAIHFGKGCYVGQEVTARLEFRSKKGPPKGLYRTRYTGDAPPGSPITTPSGQTVGWLGSYTAHHALCVVQHRVAEHALQVESVPLGPCHKPDWLDNPPPTR